MHITQLNLIAFGPFTQRQLNFDIGRLQLIYGPNEAGKSSALRALRQLLYGIPERTSDNFLHANDQLRIGGTLRLDSGETLPFIRRKGRKHRLFDNADRPIDEAQLKPFLHGVTAEMFETMFAIDHPALVAGGEAILEQRGEVGEALYSAALGRPTLRQLLTQLDNEAEALFRPRGSTQRINKAIKQHQELTQAIRQQSLISHEWDEQRQQVERTEQALTATQQQLVTERTALHRLQRLERVLPKLAQRRRLQQALTELGHVVILTEATTTQRQQLISNIEAAQERVERATTRLNAWRAQWSQLTLNPDLIAQAERIKALYPRLGSHRKAMLDRPHLEAERVQHRNAAAARLQEIRPDLTLTDTAPLHAVIGQRAALIELSAQQSQLQARLAQATQALHETEQRLRRLRIERDQAPPAPESDALRAALVEVRKLGDIDQMISAMDSEIATLGSDCHHALARLPLWQGKLSQLLQLALPSRETIEHHAAELTRQQQQLAQWEEKRSDYRERVQRLTTDRNALQYRGAIPSETDLNACRTQRDALWQQLRAEGLTAEDQAAQGALGATLPDQFEQRLNESDEIADRLRREADRVQQLATLRAEIERVQQQLTSLEATGVAHHTAYANQQAAWRAVWQPSGIEPTTPQEMRGWLSTFEAIRQQAETLQRNHRQRDALQQQRAAAVAQLQRLLTTTDAAAVDTDRVELAPLLQRSEALADQLDERRRQHAVWQREITEREIELEALTAEQQRATTALTAWQQQWQQTQQQLGFAQPVSPAGIHDLIEQIQRLLGELETAAKLAQRIAGIDADAAQFRDEVASIVTPLVPTLANASIDEAVAQLNALLAESVTTAAKRDQLAAQIEQAEADERDDQGVIVRMRQRLEALCRDAGCQTVAELVVAEQRSAEAVQLQTAITAVEQTIDEGEGMSISELEAEVATIDRDHLAGAIAALQSRIDDELEPRRLQLAEEMGRVKSDLERLDGSDQAAQRAAEAQTVLAAIRADSERYLRVKLAATLLRDQIEQYRQANQGPLIERASAHFAALTCGAFCRLISDFNDRDEPILVGIRSNQQPILVEGMSAGTRDQLYLALRLASLAHYREGNERMPFVVDDILVDFDDQRSSAALQELMTLSAQGQVILFTHHQRVVEQAEAIAADRVTVHQIIDV